MHPLLTNFTHANLIANKSAPTYIRKNISIITYIYIHIYTYIHIYIYTHKLVYKPTTSTPPSLPAPPRIYI